ncbi:unnamed protein product [Camellia sinensis]
MCDVAQRTTLQISPRLPVEKSSSSKHGAIVLCERVLIHGLSRLKNLRKFAHSVKVNVSSVSSSARLPNVEVYFHRNFSLGIGMCPQGQWEKLVKEFFSYRIMFLVLGIIITTLASSVSNSLVFYYSSAMAVGIILVILVVLFQGMTLPLTGRKNSVAIFVGLGSFLLHYLPRLLRSVLTEMGINEDMYKPVAGNVSVGFSCPSRSLVGFLGRSQTVHPDYCFSYDSSSSVDPLLAAEALLCGVMVSLLFRRITRTRFIRHLYKNLRRTIKHSHRYQIPGSSPSKDSYDEYVHNIRKPDNSDFLKPCLIRTPPSQLSDSETHYSCFHKTPEQRKFSKDEWEKFTKDSTKKALEELVSSPDFSKWAVVNAERITLTPKDTPDPPHEPCHSFSRSRSTFEILLNPDHGWE